MFTCDVNQTRVGTLSIVNNGTGNQILADTFGVGKIFNAATGRIIGEVNVVVPAVNFNALNSLIFSVSVSSFTRDAGNGFYSVDFFKTVSFPTTGPVFLNLPPGVTVNGDGIVDNHYTNPFAAAAGTQSALNQLLLLDD